MSAGQPGGGRVMVWRICSSLMPIKHHLDTAAYASIAADHMRPFRAILQQQD